MLAVWWRGSFSGKRLLVAMVFYSSPA